MKDYGRTFPAGAAAGKVLTSDADGDATWEAVGGLAAASQAQAEAGTADTVAITPLSANWHPGVAKMWLKCNGAGTSINASWNITSITDTAEGLLTATIATDFSSADWALHINILQASYLGNVFLQTEGSFKIIVYNNFPPTTYADPASYFAVGFGDQ